MTKASNALPSSEALAQIALEVATAAGALVLAGWRHRPQFSRKGVTDLVTEFDLASEQLLRERLATLAPGIPVLGEERGGLVPEGPVWICDPLDGTTNFVHGHPIWCVSVGIWNGPTPLAGAVVAPVLHTSWCGFVGGTAQRNGEPCRVSETNDSKDALVGTGFPYTGREVEPTNNFASFERVKRAVRAVRRCGSAAIDGCFVADGTYDAYWERGLKPWDAAAAIPVLLAAGGTYSNLDGSGFSLSRGDLLASNGKVHPAISQLVMG